MEFPVFFLLLNQAVNRLSQKGRDVTA